MISPIDTLSDRDVWDQQPKPHKLGLVLGGGAARGVAHIGVLEVLEEQRIYPQVIVGTSVGALVGGLYAAGVSSRRLVSLVHELSWLDLVSLELPSLNLLDLAKSLPLGLLDLDKLIDWVENVVGGPVRFHQLNLPFAAVAGDVVTNEVVIMNEGLIAPAIRASCGVPGIFTPYWRRGRLLMDGVAVNNLPVRAAQSLGADYVVAVDLLPLGGRTLPEPRNVIEMSIQALYTLARATQIEAKLADVIIAPDIAHVNLVDLRSQSIEDLLQAGRLAAEAVLPQIRRDLGRS